MLKEQNIIMPNISHSKTTNIINWNVQWVTPNSKRGDMIFKIISDRKPEVMCITEGYKDFLSLSGYTITSQEDYGYKIKKGRRKVILWSKNPWANVDDIGHIDMPKGRYVSGSTETSVGLINFIGVCIPWKDAHVRTGRKDRQPWQDHLKYLNCLEVILKNINNSSVVILGDFNQRIPRVWTPKHIYNQLITSFNGNFITATTGNIPEIQKQTIDHVVHSSDLKSLNIGGINNELTDGSKLSDHFGIEATIYRN